MASSSASFRADIEGLRAVAILLVVAGQVAEYLRQAIAMQPKAHWLETASFVCPDGQCQAMRTIGNRDIVVYRDNQHLTASFAAEASEHFLRQIQESPGEGIRIPSGEPDR